MYFIGIFGCSYAYALLPIKGLFPDLWAALSYLRSLIVTTRNGLFF